MSWRVTVPCTAPQAEALPDADGLFRGRFAAGIGRRRARPGKARRLADPRLFRPSADGRRGRGPGAARDRRARRSSSSARQDWVTMSQAGLAADPRRPILPSTRRPTAPDADRINFEIDAGLAFGTGQHATTAGCLEALDLLRARRLRVRQHRRHRHRHRPAGLRRAGAVAGGASASPPTSTR